MQVHSSNQSSARRLTAILFADVVGYSAMMGENEVETVKDLKDHFGEVLPLIEQNEGRIVNLAGDGILAEFESAVRSVECAIYVQELMARRNSNALSGRRMDLRIGLNIAQVIDDGDTIYGDGVNIAARIEQLAEPRTVYASGAICAQIRGDSRFALNDLGQIPLHNIANPVHVFRIDPTAVQAEPPDADILQDGRPTIGVLPFEDLSGLSDNDFLADGLTEDVSSRLSCHNWLDVVAHNSTVGFGSRLNAIQQASRELRLRYILTGTIRRAGNRIRVVANLFEGATGKNLWTERIDRELDDIFLVEDEITEHIASTLAPEITAKEIARVKKSRATDFNSWDLYIRAVSLIKSQTKSDNLEAIDLLERAAQSSPEFGAIYARLSNCLLQQVYCKWSAQPETTLAETERFARKCLAVDPGEALGHDALASYLQFIGELEGAADQARQALDISPSCAPAYGTLVTSLAFLGDHQHALQAYGESERFSLRDPDRSSALMGLVIAHFVAERYEDCVKAARDHAMLKPNWYGSQVYLSAALAHLGQLEEAKRSVASLLEILPDFTVGVMRGQLMVKHPSDGDRLVSGLQLAGLSD
jgi:TolB-like protein